MFKEKNVFSFFESLGFTEQDLKLISESVQKRNVYAHPRGRIIVKTSEELNDLIQKNIQALEKVHSEIKSKVCNLFIEFIDKNFDDFEDELNEIDNLNQKIEEEQDDEQKKLLNKDLNKTIQLIEEKIRDFFIQENYLNKRDVNECLQINFDEHTNLSRLDEKKKLFNQFKTIFTEE
jgi:DNA anti-recombination protein RmuC